VRVADRNSRPRHGHGSLRRPGTLVFARSDLAAAVHVLPFAEVTSLTWLLVTPEKDARARAQARIVLIV